MFKIESLPIRNALLQLGLNLEYATLAWNVVGVAVIA